MTLGIVSSCGQTTWPFICDYLNFSASNGTVPQKWRAGYHVLQMELFICSLKSLGTELMEATARLCLLRICNLNLPAVRHSSEKCYVMVLLCGLSSCFFYRYHLITSHAGTVLSSSTLASAGLPLESNQGCFSPEIACICEHCFTR